MLRYIAISLMLIAQLSLTAQEEIRMCGTHSHEAEMLQNREYLKAKMDFEEGVQKIINARKLSKTAAYDIIKIPVVVHIMHNNYPLGYKQNITDETVRSQIKILNEDFRRLNADTSKTRNQFKSIVADARIEFCLATVDPNCNPTSGIVRIATAKDSYDTDDASISSIKSLSYWPSDYYLNIWVTSLNNSFLGLATFPYGTGMPGMDSGPDNSDAKNDGVVINYKAFGNVGSSVSKKYNKGRTTTHEIGHWFGLRHIWGDDNCGTDYCDDTPTQKKETTDCNQNVIDCDLTGYAMVENYMDYTVDSCMNSFTANQVDRMRAAIEKSERRTKLVLNNQCERVPETNYKPESEGFEEVSQKQYLHFSPKMVLTNEGAYRNSAYSALFSGSGSDTLFVSDILSLNDPKLSYVNFDIVALNKSSTSPLGNLKIDYSIGCSNIWKNYASFPVNQFLKRGSSTSLEASDWFGKSSNIGLLKTDYIKLRFVYENLNNSTLDIYLDNILFSKSTKSSLDVHFRYEAEELVLDPFFLGVKNLELTIYSTEGKLVYSKSFENISSQRIQLNNLLNNNQLYIAKMVLDNETYYFKFADLE